MGLSYRKASAEELVARLTKRYDAKQVAYNKLHDELSRTNDVECNDLFMSEETDRKIVELTYLKEEIEELAQQLKQQM